MFIEIQDSKDDQIVALNTDHVVKVSRDVMYTRYATMIELSTGSLIFTNEATEDVRAKVKSKK